jgi:transporter family-2 protein
MMGCEIRYRIQIIIREGNMQNLTSIILIGLAGAGMFGLIVIASISYTIPRVGVAAAITTIVAGQLLVATILDHYGLLEATIRPLNLTRIIGMAVVLFGVWLTAK